MNKVFDEALAAAREQIFKAAELKTTYTFSPATRSIFSPENLDPKVKLLAPVDTPLVNRFPRTGGKGEATAWKRMTSKLHTNVVNSGTDTTIFVADGGTPSGTTQTYSVVSAPYKLLGRDLEIGVLANKASEGDGQESMFSQRERVKLKELMLGEEEAIIGGDVDISALQFDGLHKQITTYSGTYTYITASGIQTEVKKIWDEGQSPTLMVVNGSQLKYLADDLEKSGAIQRVMISNQGSVTVGQRVSSIVNDVDGTAFDVVASRYVGKTALLLTEKDASGEVWIEMEDLIPTSRADIATATLSARAFLFKATVLKVMGEPFQVQLTTAT